MSDGIIFYNYMKELFDKEIIKEAAKKDEAYNIVPPKAGPDSLADESGWELTEIAHPEQCYLVESQQIDGIVENGVEQQKADIEIAKRNPRGVLAELVSLLTKTANTLDEEQTEESIKLANEIDNFLEKLAKVSDVAKYVSAVKEVLDRFGDLDWTYNMLKDNRGFAKHKLIIDSLTNGLKKYLAYINRANDFQSLYLTKTMAQKVLEYNNSVMAALDKTGDIGDDPDEAQDAWLALATLSDIWLKNIEFGTTEKAQPKAEQGVPGVATKMPGKAVGYSVTGPQVGELQQLVGAKVDEKFGPQTFAAVMKAAEDNYNLKEYLHSAPNYMKGYTYWDMPAVEHAILKIKQFRQSKPLTNYYPIPGSSGTSELFDPYAKKELMEPYTKEYAEGWRGREESSG